MGNRDGTTCILVFLCVLMMMFIRLDYISPPHIKENAIHINLHEKRKSHLEFDREDTKNVEIMENILRSLSCRDCLISDKYVPLLFSVS